MDDSALVAAALAGGPEAFAPIVERYQDAVFGVALARVGSFHDAQDVAQAVLVEAYERLSNLREPGKLGAWLRKMTIHRSQDLWRRRQREMANLDEIPEPAANATPTRRRKLKQASKPHSFRSSKKSPPTPRVSPRCGR